MTEATQTATPTDARQASMSRVQTQDTVLASLNPPQAASEPAKGEKPEGESKDEGETKPKRSPQERIQDLANKRREAEEKAEATSRENAELRSRLAVLEAHAAPIQDDPRPVRSAFTTNEAYEDELAKWGGRQAIREEADRQAKARIEAEQAEIAAQWTKRQEKAMKELPDYADVVGKSEVQIPDHVHQALLESEMGPQIGYYLALHPEEAKRLRTMRPIQAVYRVNELGRELASIAAEDEPPPRAKEEPAPKKSKAPEPIEPVKSVPSASSGSTSDFEEYKRRRLAGK